MILQKLRWDTTLLCDSGAKRMNALANPVRSPVGYNPCEQFTPTVRLAQRGGGSLRRPGSAASSTDVLQLNKIFHPQLVDNPAATLKAWARSNHKQNGQH